MLVIFSWEYHNRLPNKLAETNLGVFQFARIVSLFSEDPAVEIVVIWNAALALIQIMPRASVTLI